MAVVGRRYIIVNGNDRPERQRFTADSGEREDKNADEGAVTKTADRIHLDHA